MSNPVVHWEIAGPDAGKLAVFYGDLFGWGPRLAPGTEDYHLTSAEDAGVGGGIGRGNERMPNYVTVYVQVDDVDAALRRAEGLGGSALVERTVIAGMVTFGLFEDPAGNVVGVVEAETPTG